MSLRKLNFANTGVAVLMALFALTWLTGDKRPTPVRDATLATAVNWLLSNVDEKTERVVDLPEDGSVWHTVFIWPANNESDSTSQRLAANFAATPRLQSLLAQTKVHNYDPDDQLYQRRYAAFFGNVAPAVMLQRDDGKVVYKRSGANIPTSGETIADEMAQAIRDCGPFRPRPTPTPTPQPSPTPTPGPIPDIGPSPDEPDENPTEDAPLLLLLIPLLTAAAGAYFQHKKGESG